ncbi:hypothetical protein C5167_042826 [Papaver somniferum]|uniref:Uncharacterized protein n=1 Tax=Papaver somniferum TaxID=3469 RepID=A0A4Y7L720_PAPSO|nr:hypothetical protein C5167_042826 [Papaver somniferum]
MIGRRTPDVTSPPLHNFKFKICMLSSIGITCVVYRKHKYEPVPRSPDGIVDVNFNSDSSNDSWIATKSVAVEFPKFSFKKSRVQIQQLAANRVAVELRTNPRSKTPNIGRREGGPVQNLKQDI